MKVPLKYISAANAATVSQVMDLKIKIEEEKKICHNKKLKKISLKGMLHVLAFCHNMGI